MKGKVKTENFAHDELTKTWLAKEGAVSYDEVSGFFVWQLLPRVVR
jgi:hypothetical protein